MIIRENLPLTRTFYFVANRVFLFFAIDIAITLGYTVYHQEWLSIPQLPLGLAGAALTVFLAFRIKAAYDRWWEARTLWGGLVNWSRTLARRCQILPSSDSSEGEKAAQAFQQRMTYLQIAYVMPCVVICASMIVLVNCRVGSINRTLRRSGSTKTSLWEFSC